MFEPIRAKGASVLCIVIAVETTVFLTLIQTKLRGIRLTIFESLNKRLSKM